MSGKINIRNTSYQKDIERYIRLNFLVIISTIAGIGFLFTFFFFLFTVFLFTFFFFLFFCLSSLSGSRVVWEKKTNIQLFRTEIVKQSTNAKKKKEKRKKSAFLSLSLFVHILFFLDNSLPLFFVSYTERIKALIRKVEGYVETITRIIIKKKSRHFSFTNHFLFFFSLSPTVLSYPLLSFSCDIRFSLLFLLYSIGLYPEFLSFFSLCVFLFLFYFIYPD